MLTHDTIAAIATAPGQGGVAIVRLSGPEAESILLQVFRPAKNVPLTSHMLTYGHAVDAGETIDECMAVLMRAPRSYTREDVAEIQLHGGGYIAQRVLELNPAAKAFAALQRAFENDKDKAARCAEVLYCQSLLIAGLPLEDPAAYAELVCSLMD